MFLNPISTPKGGEVKLSSTLNMDFFKKGACAKREGGCVQSVQQIAKGGQEKNECLSKVAKGGAGLPSATSQRGLPGFGPCPKGADCLVNQFYALFFT